MQEEAITKTMQNEIEIDPETVSAEERERQNYIPSDHKRIPFRTV